MIPANVQAALESGAQIRDISYAKNISSGEAADIIKAAAKVETEWKAGKLVVWVYHVAAAQLIHVRVVQIVAAMRPAARGPLRAGEFLRVI